MTARSNSWTTFTTRTRERGRVTTTSIMEARLVKRGELPICWLDMMASSTSTKRANVPNSDLLTRLASRVYTRHLARQVLRHLSKQVA